MVNIQVITTLKHNKYFKLIYKKNNKYFKLIHNTNYT